MTKIKNKLSSSSSLTSIASTNSLSSNSSTSSYNSYNNYNQNKNNNQSKNNKNNKNNKNDSSSLLTTSNYYNYNPYNNNPNTHHHDHQNYHKNNLINSNYHLNNNSININTDNYHKHSSNSNWNDNNPNNSDMNNNNHNHHNHYNNNHQRNSQVNNNIFYSCDDFYQPMYRTTNSMVSVSRTTGSDVMCIINTSKPTTLTSFDQPRHRTLKPIATLPYKSPTKLRLPEGDTEYMALKNVEAKEKYNIEFKRERDIFFQKLENERTEKSLRERFYIVKIQAVVRGFLVRPRTKVKRKSQPIIPIRHVGGTIPDEVQKLQNELCSYAQSLGLKPIPGLSLEARSKHNRRREKIILAASIRISAFFKLTLLALRAKKTSELAKQNIQNRAAMKIQKFFRYILREALKKKKQNIQREKAVLKIQTRFRIFCDWRRVRKMRERKFQLRKEFDSRIVIYRNLLKYYHKVLPKLRERKQKLQQNPQLKKK